MRLDRFTTMAQEALAAAQSRAASDGHAEVGGLHILAAVLADKGSPAWSIARTSAEMLDPSATQSAPWRKAKARSW